MHGGAAIVHDMGKVFCGACVFLSFRFTSEIHWPCILVGSGFKSGLFGQYSPKVTGRSVPQLEVQNKDVREMSEFIYNNNCK